MPSRRLLPHLLRSVYSSIRTKKGSDSRPYNKVIQSMVDLGIERNKAKQYVQHALDDGFVYRDNSKNDMIIIPEIKDVPDIGDHDPYCFECHIPGKLINCRNCFRSFHSKCRRSNPERGKAWPLPLSKLPREILKFHLEEDEKDSVEQIEEMELCTPCRLLLISPKKDPELSPAEVTKYLVESFATLKEWIAPDTFSRFKDSESVAMNDDDLTLVRKMCIKYPITLEHIQTKFDSYLYKTVTKFYVDILSVQHNLGIVYGTEVIGQEYTASEYMSLDAYYAISELRQCKTCFYHSIHPEKNWFCEPCDPLHPLVFAKQRGYGYWPAKVMQIKGKRYDVRFFGHGKSRAIVSVKDIITYTPDKETNIGVRVTSGFNKAMVEMVTHRELIALMLQKISNENNNNENANANNNAEVKRNIDNNAEAKGNANNNAEVKVVAKRKRTVKTIPLKDSESETKTTEPALLVKRKRASSVYYPQTPVSPTSTNGTQVPSATGSQERGTTESALLVKRKRAQSVYYPTHVTPTSTNGDHEPSATGSQEKGLPVIFKAIRTRAFSTTQIRKNIYKSDESAPIVPSTLINRNTNSPADNCAPVPSTSSSTTDAAALPAKRQQRTFSVCFPENPAGPERTAAVVPIKRDCILPTEDASVEKFRKMLDAATSMEQIKILAIRAYESDIGRLRCSLNLLRKQVEEMQKPK